MRPISPPLKIAIDRDPYFRKCARREFFHDHDCKGRITMDHAFIYAGRQIDELWNFVPTCAYAHDVDNFQDGHTYDKEKQEFLALRRATISDLQKYERGPWVQKIKYLGLKFGPVYDNI